MKFSLVLVVALLAVTVTAAPSRHGKHHKSVKNKQNHSNYEDNSSYKDNSNREDNSNHQDNSKNINQNTNAGGGSKPLLGLNLLGGNTKNTYVNNASIS